MAILVHLFHLFCDLCLKIVGLGLKAIEEPGSASIYDEVQASRKERRALLDAQTEALAQLSGRDQMLIWFADGYFTPARNARRKYWQKMDARAFAVFYRSIRLTAEQLEEKMTEEKMPGYFKKKVREHFATFSA